MLQSFHISHGCSAIVEELVFVVWETMFWAVLLSNFYSTLKLNFEHSTIMIIYKLIVVFLLWWVANYFLFKI